MVSVGQVIISRYPRVLVLLDLGLLEQLLLTVHLVTPYKPLRTLLRGFVGSFYWYLLETQRDDTLSSFWHLLSDISYSTCVQGTPPDCYRRRCRSGCLEKKQLKQFIPSVTTVASPTRLQNHCTGLRQFLLGCAAGIIFFAARKRPKIL